MFCQVIKLKTQVTKRLFCSLMLHILSEKSNEIKCLFLINFALPYYYLSLYDNANAMQLKITNKCTNCGLCKPVCPEDCIIPDDSIPNGYMNMTG